jgi:hypothetical protein
MARWRAGVLARWRAAALCQIIAAVAANYKGAAAERQVYSIVVSATCE